MTSQREQVNKETAKVSVIMPAYNGEKYIAASMRCVLEQTHTNVELIVIDDGSTDRTAEIVKEFQASDERVIYVFQQNGGQGQARNKGIRLSCGEVIAFLDQDDLWVKENWSVRLKR
jgi:glycosyltransferase involved in cell wall biosynthesis